MLLLLFSNYEQYINTSHPDFIGGSRAVSRLMTRNNENNLPPTGANTSSENGVRLPVGATPMSTMTMMSTAMVQTPTMAMVVS
jgi:hypothetical protein